MWQASVFELVTVFVSTSAA